MHSIKLGVNMCTGLTAGQDQPSCKAHLDHWRRKPRCALSPHSTQKVFWLQNLGLGAFLSMHAPQKNEASLHLLPCGRACRARWPLPMGAGSSVPGLVPRPKLSPSPWAPQRWGQQHQRGWIQLFRFLFLEKKNSPGQRLWDSVFIHLVLFVVGFGPFKWFDPTDYCYQLSKFSIFTTQSFYGLNYYIFRLYIVYI